MRNSNWLIPVLFGKILILVGFLMKVLNFGNFVQIVILVALLWYAGETRSMKKATEKSTKYLEYQTRPTGYFLLYRSSIFVKNTSNFLIKFYFKMSSGDKILNDCRWKDNPLYIYPGAGYMGFPQAFSVDKLVDGEIKIEYRIVPSHIDDEDLNRNIQMVEWNYDKKTGKWKAPNGIEEQGVLSLLPKVVRDGGKTIPDRDG